MFPIRGPGLLCCAYQLCGWDLDNLRFRFHDHFSKAHGTWPAVFRDSGSVAHNRTGPSSYRLVESPIEAPIYQE